MGSKKKKHSLAKRSRLLTNILLVCILLLVFLVIQQITGGKTNLPSQVVAPSTTGPCVEPPVTLSLSWNPHIQAQDLSGFYINYGVDPSALTNRTELITDGSATRKAMAGYLTCGTTYYFTVQAVGNGRAPHYNAISPPSNPPITARTRDCVCSDSDPIVAPPPLGYHLGCNSSQQCRPIQGSGANQCNTDSYCRETSRYMGCTAEGQCIPKTGIGFDSCVDDPDCYSDGEEPVTPEYPTFPELEYHLACNYTAKTCALTPGAGSNLCTIGNDPLCRCPAGQVEKYMCDYRIETSTDLRVWQDTGSSGTVECGEGGTVDQNDSNREINKYRIDNPSSAPNMFFRLAIDHPENRRLVCVSEINSSVLGGTSVVLNASDGPVIKQGPSLWSRIVSFFSSLGFVPGISSDVINNAPSTPDSISTGGDQKNVRNVQIITIKPSPGDKVTLSGPFGENMPIDTSEPMKFSITEGTKLSITATPGPNSTFSGWKGGCQAIEGNTCSFTVTRAKGVTATFAPKPKSILTTKTSGTGKGTISGIVNPVFGFDTILGFYNTGTTTTLTATPNSGSTFSGWSGACAGNVPCILVMDSDKSVTAGFNAIVNGVCSTTLNSCTAGTFVDRTDTTAQYQWSCIGLNGGTTISCTKNKPTYTLKAVRVGPGTILRGTTAFASGIFPLGTTVTLTAKPATGYRFVSWSGCNAVSGATCTVSVDKSKTVTATFR